ncbi:MAG: LysR family transcriptional regulator [Burkholderiaceae bacterium]
MVSTKPKVVDAFARGPRFDVRQMRAFLCVAEELHFGRAAARLFTSQPALSRTVHALEQVVGTPLLERSTRRVRLTAAGEAFAAECRIALMHLDRAAGAAVDAAEGRAGRLRLAYNDFAINGRLPTLLRDFRQRYPRNQLDLEYMPSSKQRHALLEGRIDIGFMIGEFESTRVLNVLVDQDDFVALLPDGHPLAARRTLRLTDLANEPFVLGTEDAFSSFRRLVYPLCHEAGFMPDVVQQASNTSGIFGMVAAGVGVSLFAGCARNLKRAGVVVKALDDVAEVIPLFAAWPAEDGSEVLRRFTEFLVANAQLGVRAKAKR